MVRISAHKKQLPSPRELHIFIALLNHIDASDFSVICNVYLCLHLKMNFLHSVGKTSLCFPLSWPLYPVSVYRLLCIPVSVEVLFTPGQKLFPVLRKSDQFLSLYLHLFLIFAPQYPKIFFFFALSSSGILTVNSPFFSKKTSCKTTFSDKCNKNWFFPILRQPFP